jgi:hypothetical protein
MPDTPKPEPHPLLRAFDHIYLGAGEEYWGLPSRDRSLKTLRPLFASAAASVCRSSLASPRTRM